MIRIVSEYFFCLLYVIGLFICVYPYIEKKRSIISTIFFLIIYGFIDFIITGDFFIKFNEYIISNLLVIISDFIMVCIFEKNLIQNYYFIQHSISAST